MDMAKAKTFDDIIKDIMDNYADLRFQATENVAKEAVKDIHNGAVNILHNHYYAWKPKKRFKTKADGGKYKNGSKKKWARGGYTRTYSLEHSLVSSYDVRRTDKNVICEISVSYSPSALKDYVESNNISAYTASKNVLGTQRAPLEEWVINNFLEGRHPYTDGSSEPGTPVHYIQDPQNRLQWAGMEKMFLRYAGRILPRDILVEMINLQGR
jgi:hypothetical protein